MNNEPQAESDIMTPPTTFKDRAADCFDCIVDSILRTWDCICDAFLDLLDWIWSKFSCLPRSSVEKSIKNESRAAASSPNNQPTTAIQQNKLNVSSVSSDTNLRKVKSSQMTSHQSNQSAGSSSVSMPTTRSPIGSTTGTASLKSISAQEYQEPQQSPPEPVKIDFVPTGSIFGDRKKTSFDHNMLQMENGRFRSPGQPRVIQGPNGRTIRVSFISGFPPVKSIESTRSLVSRKSIDYKSIDGNK